jgi:hypothetical protein
MFFKLKKIKIFNNKMDEESKIKQLKTLYEYSSIYLDKYINPYLNNEGELKLKEYYNEEKFRKTYNNEPTNNIEEISYIKIQEISYTKIQNISLSMKTTYD